MGYRIYFGFLVLILFFSCGKSQDEEYILTIGEPLQIDKNISIVVDSLNDSRCPLGATCFWAGDVTAYMHLQDGHQQMDTLLRLNHPGRPLQWANAFWMLTRVTPHPKLDEPVRPSDYRIYLRREPM